MIEIIVYNPSYKEQWDGFVAAAKNSVFLFHRDYMEYHADRFTDHSLLFFQDRKLKALLPANKSQQGLISHGGLTFGGLVVDASMTTRLMLELFGALLDYLRPNGVASLQYKCIPHIYHRLPAEEDRYALYLHGGWLCRRDITSTVEISVCPSFLERRRRGVRKAQSARVVTRASEDYAAFWSILEDNLVRVHETRPVHTVNEMLILRDKFPDHIKLFASYWENRMVAGVVVYENTTVAHAQYISASEEGKRIGALDALFAWLITDVYKDKTYFDFGISTEANGTILNAGLIEQKEGFGARGVVHDHYAVDVLASESVLVAS